MKTSKPTTDSIEATEADYLFIGTSQLPFSGKGLFTAIDIYKDEVIAVFKGEILTDLQAELRSRKGSDQYFIAMLDGSIMDSKKVKCFAKFANDAKGTLGSSFKNCAKITIDEQNQVALTATRNIKKEEEIFCAYGSAYWKKHRVTESLV